MRRRQRAPVEAPRRAAPTEHAEQELNPTEKGLPPRSPSPGRRPSRLHRHAGARRCRGCRNGRRARPQTSALVPHMQKPGELGAEAVEMPARDCGLIASDIGWQERAERKHRASGGRSHRTARHDAEPTMNHPSEDPSASSRSAVSPSPRPPATDDRGTARCTDGDRCGGGSSGESPHDTSCSHLARKRITRSGAALPAIDLIAGSNCTAQLSGWAASERVRGSLPQSRRSFDAEAFALALGARGDDRTDAPGSADLGSRQRLHLTRRRWTADHDRTISAQPSAADIRRRGTPLTSPVVPK